MEKYPAKLNNHHHSSEESISIRSLMAIGIAGGIAPCLSAQKQVPSCIKRLECFRALACGLGVLAIYVYLSMAQKFYFS
jgi:hypothetical protein